MANTTQSDVTIETIAPRTRQIAMIPTASRDKAARADLSDSVSDGGIPWTDDIPADAASAHGSLQKVATETQPHGLRAPIVHEVAEMPHAKKPRMGEGVRKFAAMAAENAAILSRDEMGAWEKGIRRFNASASSAAQVLAWVVENTSRKLSVVATEALTVHGFHEYVDTHAGTQNDARQLQHTFVIGRSQRRAALKSIPGFERLVAEAQAAVESMRLADAPNKLEWLTGHILNQGDVNARFEYHKDTSEERNKRTGRRDRRVLYTAIVKLNHGGCTSMEVCGQPEVFYHSLGGNGIIFRSNLHHRTEKAEQGIWKLALFFGVFM